MKEKENGRERKNFLNMGLASLEKDRRERLNEKKINDGM